MKHIGDVIDVGLIKEIKAEKPAASVNYLSSNLVDWIFVVQAMACKGFDEYYADREKLAAVKAYWYSEFTREGIVQKKQVQLGVNKFAWYKYPKPPQLGEFLEWCKPAAEDAGLLSPDKAYTRSLEILRGITPSDLSAIQIDLIKHAIQESDSYFLKTNSRDKTEPLFKRNYVITIRNHIEGDLKPIPKAIEAPVGQRYQEQDSGQRISPERLKQYQQENKDNLDRAHNR